MCGARGLPVTRIGVVDGEAIEVQGEFTLPLAELRDGPRGDDPGAAGLSRAPTGTSRSPRPGVVRAGASAVPLSPDEHRLSEIT